MFFSQQSGYMTSVDDCAQYMADNYDYTLLCNETIRKKINDISVYIEENVNKYVVLLIYD